MLAALPAIIWQQQAAPVQETKAKITLPLEGTRMKRRKKEANIYKCAPFDTRNWSRSLCVERIKTWAVSWLELCTPIGLWNDLYLHKVHAKKKEKQKGKTRWAGIHRAARTQEDYYRGAESAQLIQRREGTGRRGAAVLHGDPPGWFPPHPHKSEFVVFASFSSPVVSDLVKCSRTSCLPCAATAYQ